MNKNVVRNTKKVAIILVDIYSEFGMLELLKRSRDLVMRSF